MANNLHHPLVEKGIAALFKELGPVETIEFFQRLGVRKDEQGRHNERQEESNSLP